jgi:hypothetical protein
VAKTKTNGRGAETKKGLRALGGTVAGAAAGSLLGPLGAAAGAVVGGLAGVLSDDKAKRSPGRKARTARPAASSERTAGRSKKAVKAKSRSR